MVKPNAVVPGVASDSGFQSGRHSVFETEGVEKLVRSRVPTCSRSLIAKAFAATCGVMAAGAFSVYRIHIAEEAHIKIQRTVHRDTASSILSGVQRQLETSVSSTEALAAIIQLGSGKLLLQPNQGYVDALVESTESYAQAEAGNNETSKKIAQDSLEASRLAILNLRFDFQSVAESLIKTYQGISNLQLAPSGVVSCIHPLQGNEGAIGHDLFFDVNRREGALTAISAGKVIFVGPITLKQNGKQAILARNPVFINKPGFQGPRPEFPSWWGFATMLVETDELIRATPLRDAERYDVSYVLYAETSSGAKLITTSADVPSKNIDEALSYAREQKMVTSNLEIDELHVAWVLLSWPTSGWKDPSPGFAFNVTLSICFGMASLVSVYAMLLRESIIADLQDVVKQNSYFPQPGNF